MKCQPERIFLFRLAKELGMTVKRLLSELDSHEIAEWLAFFKIEQEEWREKQQEEKNKKALESANLLKANLMAFSPPPRKKKNARNDKSRME